MKKFLGTLIKIIPQTVGRFGIIINSIVKLRLNLNTSSSGWQYHWKLQYANRKLTLYVYFYSPKCISNQLKVPLPGEKITSKLAGGSVLSGFTLEQKASFTHEQKSKLQSKVCFKKMSNHVFQQMLSSFKMK